MNRNHHRIVFNAARGQLMAVSETATAGTGSAANSEGPARTAKRWRKAGAALLTALAALNSQAQISADPTAAGNLRPTVLTAPNGVPLVNITTPSAAGVSRNVYRQFDVGTQGAILNNSRTNVQTQLGGWVQGNPWLARGPARVILNEINSSQPSQLNGWVEVGGQRAEVVIANPAGIQVNGGGFINASRATLTTGTPVMNAGALEGFRVQGGQVRIEGLGLDASTTDHAAILARAIEVNAGIWAKALTVVAGVNDVSADTAAVTPLAAASGVGPAPAFALDVAALGGMYAGQIHLVGTEAGLGVRNAGSLGANSGALVLDANGWLHNTGALIASQVLDLKTAGNAGITQHGLIDAQTTRITTGELVNEAAGRIYGDSIAIQAENLTNDTGAVIAARNTLTATAGTLINREGALLLSGGNMTLAASERLENRSASIEALGNLTISTPVLVNANDHMTHTVVTDATTNRTVYFTPGGAVDASEVAWRVVKPLDGFSQDAYDAYQREWLVPKSSAYAHPDFKGYYLGALPFVAGHIESFSDGESGSSWWVGDAFNYSRQSPIWAHFGMTAPTWDAPGQKPGGSFDSEGNLISPPDPQALVAWQTQAAPWVELTARVATFKTAVEGQFLRFDAWSSYAQTTQRAVMTHSEPARMVSGGDMNLNVANSALNQDSEIVAGGALVIGGRNVINQATEVNAPTSRSGTLSSWGVTGQSGPVWDRSPDYGWIHTPYAETIANNVKLPGLRYEPNSNAVPRSGTHPPLSPTLGNALFNLSPDPDSRAVFETDPRFASHRQWLSSDYLLNALAVDPATTQKRLGDGFIEQRLIREQVSALTGQRFLGDFSSDEQQYQILMNAGATFAQAHQLRPGITLSANQVATLTSDIVWLETQTVTLPDGSITQALVPRVYLLPRAGDLSAGGALIAGRDVQMNLSGDILNSGTIAGRDLVQINAQNVLNTGLVSGQSGVITAREDVNNIGGTVTATDALIVQAGGDLNVQTTTAQGSGAASAAASDAARAPTRSTSTRGHSRTPATTPARQRPPAPAPAWPLRQSNSRKEIRTTSNAFKFQTQRRPNDPPQGFRLRGRYPPWPCHHCSVLPMKAPRLKKSILALTVLSVLAGCATPPANTPPGALKVVYSQHYPDGSYLKEQPTEVRLVTREATTKNVAQQVGLNLLLLSVGALSFQGFSKDDLNGRTVDGPTDRANLLNPIPTDFVARLQNRVDTAIQGNDRLKTQTYAHPLVVGGGSTRLVYENLAGTDEATYRLKTDLVVYRKRGDGASIKSLMAPRTVSCADQSAQAWPQSRWAEGNYLPVKHEMDALLVTCETKVLAALDELLRD